MATIAANIPAKATYPKPHTRPIAIPTNKSNNSSAFALTLLNLTKPKATAIVAILTAPEVVASKKIDTIDTTVATTIGIKALVIKKLLVPFIFNEITRVNNIEIAKVIAMIIRATMTLSMVLSMLNNEFMS